MGISRCLDLYTSKAWLKRKAREWLMQRWKAEIGIDITTWKYSPGWEDWPFRDSKAFFNIYPRPGKTPITCRCGADSISSDHSLSKCSLFEKERDKITGLHITPPAKTKEKILDKINGPGLRALARKTGLGYGPDIRWERLGGTVEGQERSKEKGSDEDEFGEFE